MNEEELRALDECLAAEHGLTPWEIDFIEDMDKRRDRGLTTNQRRCLLDIASNIA